MESDRLDNYKEFAKYMEYPMVVFSATTGEVIECNYGAQTILGQNVQKLIMMPDKFMDKEDFWEQLHSKKSIIWHRILLIADNNRHVVSGLINEFSIENDTIYVVMFELRTDLNIGSVTLERIINNAGLVAIYMYKAEEDWKIRYISKNINLYGYTSEEFYQGKLDLGVLFTKEEGEAVNELIIKKLENRENDFVVGFNLVTEALELVPVTISVHAVKDDYGRSEGLEFVIRDMRVSKNREAQNIYLARAVEKMNMVVMVETFKGDKRKLDYISSNAKNIGLNVELLMKEYKLTEDYIHPEDREDVMDRIYSAIDNKVTGYTQKYRLVGDDGRCRYVSNKITVSSISDEEARVECLITDITEHVKSREKLINKQKTLEKKIENVMNSDNSIEGHEKELLDIVGENRLASIFAAIAKVTGLYMAVIDLKGKILTAPTGPMDNMGDFYDLFEKPELKKIYGDYCKEEQVEGIVVDMESQGIFHKISFAPIIIDNKHIATWLTCGYTEKEFKKIEEISVSHAHIAHMISEYIYHEVIVNQEVRKDKLYHFKYEELLAQDEIIRDITLASIENGMKSLDYIYQQVGGYLNIEAMGLVKYDKGNDSCSLFNEWVKSKKYLFENPEEKFKLTRYKDIVFKTFDRGELIVGGSHMLERAELYSGEKVKAMISLPVVKNKAFQGVLIYMENTSPREWSSEEIAFMKIVRDIVEGVITRSQTNTKNVAVNKGLIDTYDYLSEYIYIRDEYTNKVLYSNEALNKVLGYDFVGKDSDLLLGANTDKLGSSYGNRIVSNKSINKWQKYIKEFDKTMNICERKTHWLDNSKAVIVILSELKEEN